MVELVDMHENNWKFLNFLRCVFKDVTERSGLVSTMVVDQWPQYLITKSVNTNAIPKFLGKLNIAVADSETRSWGGQDTFYSGGGSMALICYCTALNMSHYLSGKCMGHLYMQLDFFSYMTIVKLSSELSVNAQKVWNLWISLTRVVKWSVGNLNGNLRWTNEM